jgi:glycyl-tRNA synthetase
MAHYAQDCWDAELHTSYGWIECVGHADRSAYDLEVHTAASKVDLSAREEFKTPKEVMVPMAKLNNKAIKDAFGKNQRPLREFFKQASPEQLLEVKAGLEAGEEFKVGELTLTRAIVTINMQKKKITGQKFTPHVIEPAFGLGRIFYAVLEHSYTERKGSVQKGGDAESYLKLPAFIAPIKAAILPQSVKPQFLALAENLSRLLVARSITYRIDDSTASLGRKYARSDEVGTPFSLVIDLQTPTDQKCTIRDRDSTNQVRVTFEVAANLVQDMCSGRTTWERVYATEEQFGRPSN